MSVAAVNAGKGEDADRDQQLPEPDHASAGLGPMARGCGRWTLAVSGGLNLGVRAS